MSYEAVETDVLIIGAGGAGLRAAIEASRYNVDVTIAGKEMLGKAHTVMAEGGYNAALGNADPRDNYESHFRDTIEGGAWLNDQDLAEILVKEAPDRIFDLEEFGAVFDRTPDGKLAQRMFGKQSYPRTCYVSDYTGHEMVSALVDEVRRRGIKFMQEIFVSKLLVNNGTMAGAVAIDVKSGDILVFRTKAAILATGGAGRMYEVTTNPASATGDGRILAVDAGAELTDMEMFQFHPTAMVWPPSCKGILVTEGVRGEGGMLFNVKGERFMEKYHKLLDLAPRDVISRSIATEVLEGRGTAHGGVFLKVSHIPAEIIKDRLKTMHRQFSLAGVDISKEPMEVAPAAHYYMGGVRTDVRCETKVKGLYAAGEEQGGVHGANRLGGNSIAATQVFGKIAGERAASFAKGRTKGQVNKDEIELELKRIDKISRGEKYEFLPSQIRVELNRVIWENAGIFRTGDGLAKGLNNVERIDSKMLPKMGISDAGTRQYNKELAEALETINLVRVAEILLRASILRTESRGAHHRLDTPKTDDENWLTHIVWYMDDKVLKHRLEPVVLTKLKPPS